MPYIGAVPATAFQTINKQDFSVSATTNYTLSQSVTSANDIALFINNVRQEPTYAYSASGTGLTLTTATASSDDMYCVYLGKAVGTVNPPTGSVGTGELSATGTKDSTTFLRGDNTFAEPSGGVYETALLHVVDEKANNTSPQTFSTGQNTRELTTVKTNEITGASLSSNQITLPSGTYFAQAEANGYVNARHKISLYNTTDASYTLVGLSSNSHASYYTTSPSMLSGRFTISAQKVFELRHYIQSGSASGIAVNASLVEVYANVRIWKVA